MNGRRTGVTLPHHLSHAGPDLARGTQFCDRGELVVVDGVRGFGNRHCLPRGPLREPLHRLGDVEALIAWLQAGEYDAWTAESGIHDSDGPHFGNVRTFFNNVLVDSFENDMGVHPIGAANVKELYGPGETIRGWSVMVKREVDAGEWYWFEYWDGEVIADTVAWDVCEGCHEDGVDNVLTPWPLQ